MKKFSIPKDSEFGTIVGSGHRGVVVEREGGAIVFISSAYNPLTADELREVASFLDTLTPAKNDQTIETVADLVKELQTHKPTLPVFVEGCSWIGTSEPERYEASPDVREYAGKVVIAE